MRLLILLSVLLLVACSASTMGNGFSHFMVHGGERFSPPAWYLSVYYSVIQCLDTEPLFPFELVRWTVADSIIQMPGGDRVAGLMRYPRDIFLDKRLAGNRTLVAHELIHYVNPRLGHEDELFARCQVELY